MHRIAIRWLLPAVCAVATPLVAQAQGTPRAAPDPLDAEATVPAVVYRSALTTYRRANDAKPVPWRAANDTVGRIGGWRAYAREASRPEPAASAASNTPPDTAAMPEPMPRPHGSHKH